MYENSKIGEILKRPYSLIRLRENGLIEVSSMHHFHILNSNQLRELYDIVTDALQYSTEYGDKNIMDANIAAKECYDNAVQQSVPKQSVKKHSKYSYVIKDTSRGIYKIGAANSIKNRLSAIRTANPFVELVFVIDGAENEKLLHDQFRDKNISLEWFKLTEKDLGYILHNYPVIKEYK